MTTTGRGDEATLDVRVDELQRVVDLLVRKMEDDFDCEMDYEPASVGYLDAVLAELRREDRSLSPSLFLSIGGYVGETLVQAYGGTWVEEDGSLAVEVQGQAHSQTLPVFDWVKDAYADPHEENLGQRLDHVVGDGLGPSPP
jgi:hypothetical protein